MTHLVQSSTKDVRLFSAVVAMGIPYKEEVGAVHGKDRVWLFGDVSDCGKWKLKDLLAWWGERDFHLKNPQHPFSVVKACMASGVGLKRYLANGGGIRQRKTGHSYIIEQSDEANEIPPTSRATDETHYAAILSAVGFSVKACQSAGRRRIFAIGERSDTFGYEYGQARAWWLDKSFEEKNGQHPFAYAKAVALTYTNAVAAVLSDRPLVMWRPKGSYGVSFIHPDCSKETEEKVAGWLNPDN